MIKDFQIGQIVEGKVTGIKPFGAFVALDEQTQGLVHISQVTHGFLKDIKDELNLGDVVKVKILSIENEGKKIALSIKDANPKPQREYQPSYNNSSSGNSYNKSNSYNNNSYSNNSSKEAPKTKQDKLDDLMKNWMKDSNDRQAVLNKRNKK